MSLLIALDTSVIIAGLLLHHPEHAAAVRWLEQGRRGEIGLTIAAHALAESYATLTARAPNLGKRPSEALRALTDLRSMTPSTTSRQ